MKIAVIDGLGGGLGAQIINKLKKTKNELDIIALGTNALATERMIKNGADTGATGENAIKVNVNKVDIIVGPLGLIIPNSMKGEITIIMAEAIADSNAKKFIIGMKQPHLELVGLSEKSLNDLIDDLIKSINKYINDLVNK